MQTDTADASNSKQKLQHWINKNQINKKTSFSFFFQENPSKTKGKEKHITDAIEIKSTIQGGKEKGEGKEVRSTRFWEEKCGTNMGSTGTKGSTG